ncbi:ras GTPase-activating protein [Flagelloscypha sp. PMI_526]|nr:ras GTPase-activating protein [Flagelloscypha sp. PMI_526]
MDRSDSVSGSFAYQARLLERTSSTRTTGSLARSNSQASTNSQKTQSTGSSGGGWTPTHRATNSIDSIRGRWEERAQQAAEEDTAYYGKQQPVAPSPSIDRTPTQLKRRTLPAPIIASPLSPNNTGVSVEADSPSPGLQNARIHLPSLGHSGSIRQTPPARWKRGNSVDLSTQPSALTSPRFTAEPQAASPPPQPTPTPIRRRPLSFQGHSPVTIPPPISDRTNRFTPTTPSSPSLAAPTSPVPSVMSPSVYRSSHVAKRKYGESLTSGRRLGRHLPRIASGDQEDVDPPEPPPKQPEDRIAARKERREMRLRERAQMERPPEPPMSPTRYNELILPSAANLDDVVGIPGRIRLTKGQAAPETPLPSNKLLGSRGGLWADKQRHLLQAYEYLCHVGEAQQWIEGCLQEELPFGVVEMDEGLRNGVVLAKLVRNFQGEGAVKKIYDDPKLNFRHSDNINHFFKFVQDVGLPDYDKCFVFELTDLYNKKNIPKVIYCIHALSHLMARRQLAPRIGNLIGRLEFSDEQLQQTQKGLNASGVALPNFSNIGKELAKEINEEEEEEEETEDERRDRLLLEQEESIIALQSQARGFLARRQRRALEGRLRFAEHHIIKLQALGRGLIVRRALRSLRQAQSELRPWVVQLQASIRGALARGRFRKRVREIQRTRSIIVKLQAQIRGVLVRRRRAALIMALRTSTRNLTKFQAVARANVSRNAHRQIAKTFTATPTQTSIVALQALGRGLIMRRRMFLLKRVLLRQEPFIVKLQSHCRGVLVRRQFHSQLSKLEDISLTIIRIQAAARTYLARRRLLLLIRGLRSATPAVVSLQAIARARLIQQRHRALKKSLAEAKTIKSIGSIQSFARAALARNRHQELHRKMDFVLPDVVGVQAQARGVLIREDYRAWRDHLWDHEHVATLLQALLRGALIRKNFRAKMTYFRENLSKVVKIQSLFRAKETRDQYRQLTLGTNVTVGTIKNFVHLLDDSEADFQDEIRVERMRKRVVEAIRSNQELENEIADLDVKIALVVQNVMSFEELMKNRRLLRLGNRSGALEEMSKARSLLAAHRDPFSGSNSADHEARRKLELYQQLFYLIQTHPEYLSRLFMLLGREDSPETDKRFVERTTLNLFGYGQSPREEFLLLKLFQASIRDEVASVHTPMQMATGKPFYLNVAIQYVRPKQVSYLRDTLQSIIREVINDGVLDLETDPTVIYRRSVDEEEKRLGKDSVRPKNVSYDHALLDPDTRVTYIRHLQVLQWWVERFVVCLVSVRETDAVWDAVFGSGDTTAKFPKAPDTEYAACIGRLVFYRYINTAIMTPETFELVGQTVEVEARKNLGQISRVLTQITLGAEFDDGQPHFIPINKMVAQAIRPDDAIVADVPDAETQLHAHEFLDATVPPKPLVISPNDIYSLHSLLSRHQTPTDKSDTVLEILSELGGVPLLNDELSSARDLPVSLELTNRFAHVPDPHADEKALWVKAKRGVLAVLRVQPAKDIGTALMQPVTADDEDAWQDILDAEIENEPHRGHAARQASQAGDTTYRLEDIRSAGFGEVKAMTIAHLLELERTGKVTREDGFQALLNSIALDVRAKHRKRLQRQQELESMKAALQHLAQRKKEFEERINSYSTVVERSMDTMQKGTTQSKGASVLQSMKFWSKQNNHLRRLQRSGMGTPQFGSYFYTAKKLYEQNVLLSIDKYSPRQYDKMSITMSSNTVGVFEIVLESKINGPTQRVAIEDIKIEDLLQGKYENKKSLSLFGGQAKFNFDLFLQKINKKFYV